MAEKDRDAPLEKVNALQSQLQQYHMLLELGRVIVSEMDMDVLFNVIMDRTRRFMDTEKCSVFIFDEKKNELWSRVSTDLEANEIRFSAHTGIAGWVFQNRQPLIINDAYSDPRFYPGVDRKTHFKTRNILCLPLINRKGTCIGTLQVINKTSGDFTSDDEELLLSVSHYITIALENARLYDDLKVLDKAKERVINHLSHELKTPLAVLSAAFKRLYQLLDSDAHPNAHKTFLRGKRQIQRLMDLEIKIGDILNQRPVREQRRILNIIENASDLVDSFNHQSEPQKKELLDLIAHRLDTLFAISHIRPEPINLVPFVKDILQEARSLMAPRNLDIIFRGDEPVQLMMDRQVLLKIVSGILKNAIENTPDEAMVELHVETLEEGIQITVRDYGVGITEINRELIFGGFFHTQDTDMYSSKRPYEFNAGGAGADLLRIKAFSERMDFSVRFETTRCPYIPNDTDICPGRISSCKFVQTRNGCLKTGGSTFYVVFPLSHRRLSLK
ncbi:MAG: GAF domain-containing protein [Deltaproteobacteria bacterium]|nr:GAF domain-containing protein [Deltaproteobacteria bacterium]